MLPKALIPVRIHVTAMASPSSRTPTGDDPNLLRGLFVPKLTLASGASAGTTLVALEDQIASALSFQAWDDFDNKAAGMRQQAKDTYRDRSCGGNFARTSCNHDACEQIVACKRAIRDTAYSNEATLSHVAIQLVEALAKLAERFQIYVSTGLETTASTSYGQIRHDIAIRSRGSTSRLPDATIEVKLPVRGHLLFTSRELPGTPGALASDYNNLVQQSFSSPAGSSSSRSSSSRISTSNHNRRWLRSALCQTVYATLHTKRGWGCLYNHDTAAFFRVSSTARDSSRWLSVSVSKLYKCEQGSESTLHGLLALFKSMQESDRTSQLQEFIRSLHRARSQQDERDLEENMANLSVQEQKESRDRRAGRRAERRAGQRRAAVGKRVSHVNISLSEKEEQALRSAFDGSIVLLLSFHQMFRMFLIHGEEVLGVGGFGYVVHARICGIDVAMKRANIETREVSAEAAAAELRQEIAVYKSLAMNKPNILGEAVPCLFAVCEDSKEGDVLVTECVGYGLERKRRSAGDVEDSKEWYVDGEMLTDDDKASILESAEESLRALHECGFVHNDIRWPNIRVEKESEGWHVWWIDLARAATPGAEGDMELEISWCRQLYDCV